MFSKLKRLLFLIRTKGMKWTYNYIHFITFYDTQNPILIKLLQWLQPYPSYIEIECTTKCNLKCSICEHTYWDEPNRDMSFDQFKSIIDQFPKLKWIGLTGIGESFLNKEFMDMLRYVKSKNIYVELYDSFYFMNEAIINELIDLGVDRIFASIDAATKETYEKIRVGAKFEKVMNNLRIFVKLKEEKKAYFPELCFHYIVTKDNVNELTKYIELIHSLNTDVTLIQFTRMLHYFDEVKHLFVEVPEETIREVDNKAKELGMKVVWGLNVPRNKPPINKCTAWYMPFIFVTGHVIPCCAGNEANKREFQKATSLGNVFEKSFKDIWYGEKYKELRRKIRKGEVPPPCVDCPIYDVRR